jgi:hypothetical protein
VHLRWKVLFWYLSPVLIGGAFLYRPPPILFGLPLHFRRVWVDAAVNGATRPFDWSTLEGGHVFFFFRCSLKRL